LLDSLIELTFHKGLKGLATLACVFHFDTIRQSWTENAAVTVYDLRFTFQLNVDRLTTVLNSILLSCGAFNSV